jgi:hypothetical protein
VTTSVPTWCAYASLGGVHSLTFTASPSCNLPDDAVKRTYTATIAQTNTALTIVLSGARFGTSGSLTLNQFSGRVLGTAVPFAFYNVSMYYGLYEPAGLVEQLADNPYFVVRWDRRSNRDRFRDLGHVRRRCACHEPAEWIVEADRGLHRVRPSPHLPATGDHDGSQEILINGRRTISTRMRIDQTP